MSKKTQTCHDCWQYSKDYCDLGCKMAHCYWWTARVSPSRAQDCDAYNPHSQVRKDRDEAAEEFERIEEFWEFLFKELKLSRRKAWQIIYHLQEKTHILNVEMEMCDACGKLYLTDREGVYNASESGSDWSELPHYWRSKSLCGGCLSKKSNYAY